MTSCPAPSDPRLNCLMTDSVGCNYSNAPGEEVLKYDVAQSDSTIFFMQAESVCIASPPTKI